MPVSATVISTVASTGLTDTDTVPPGSVNLSALPTRFSSTSWSLSGSTRAPADSVSTIERDLLLVGDGAKPAHDTPGKLVDFHGRGLELHRIERHPNRVDEPIHDSDQTLGLVADDLDVLARRFAQRPGHVVEQVLSGALDRREWCAQIVCDVLHHFLAPVGGLLERDLCARQGDVGAAELDATLGRELLELEIPRVELAKLLCERFELDGEVSVCVFDGHSAGGDRGCNCREPMRRLRPCGGRCKASVRSGTS